MSVKRKPNTGNITGTIWSIRWWPPFPKSKSMMKLCLNSASVGCRRKPVLDSLATSRIGTLRILVNLALKVTKYLECFQFESDTNRPCLGHRMEFLGNRAWVAMNETWNHRATHHENKHEIDVFPPPLYENFQDGIDDCQESRITDLLSHREEKDHQGCKTHNQICTPLVVLGFSD